MISGPKRDCKVKLNLASFRVAILLRRSCGRSPGKPPCAPIPQLLLGYIEVETYAFQASAERCEVSHLATCMEPVFD